MEGVAEEMIALLIQKCKSKNVKKGLEIALEIFEFQGYYDYNDWDGLTDKEKWDEVKGYLK